MAPRTARALLAAALAATVPAGLATVVANPAMAATATPYVSEIHYAARAGSQIPDRIEITAAEGTDLTGWRVVLYSFLSGGRVSVYDDRVLDRVADSPGADPSGDGVVVLDYAAPDIPRATGAGWALVDPAGTVTEFWTQLPAVVAANGPAQGLTSQVLPVQESSSTPADWSLQFVGGAWRAPAVNTFGQVNDTVGLGGGGTGDDSLCEETATPIPAVQGSGTTSPLLGRQVLVRGVVTADLQTGANGFHLQDPVGDGDPATSDGVFVSIPAATNVVVGEDIVVQGTVVETVGQTQVQAPATSIGMCGRAAVPAAVELPLPASDLDRERFEGMLVSLPQRLTVTGLFGFEDYGTVTLGSGGPLIQATEAVAPGQPARAYENENRTREIVLDDGGSIRRSSIAYVDRDNSVRIGDQVQVGPVVLGYGYDAVSPRGGERARWRLQPVTGTAEGSQFFATNPRTSEPEDVGGDVTIASFNVLNYFTTLPSENSLSRGALTPSEFAQQEAKIVAAVNALGADVVALQEIEYGTRLGKDADEALAALVGALNRDLEAKGQTPVWQYVATPQYVRPVPDVIQCALIYRDDRVDTVGESFSLGVDTSAWGNAREPVAQVFSFPDDSPEPDEQVLVVSNHFKSKGSGGSGDNADTGDGQAYYNGDRVRQANALAAAVADWSARSGEKDVYLMGDFNAYGKEDPITALTAAGYTDTAAGLGGSAYSYRFDWRLGSLDHAMLSPSAVEKLTGATIWQVNATEPFGYEYDASEFLYAPNPYRASDHNPVLVGVDLPDPVVLDPPLGTEVSVADVLAADSGVDRDGTDYDLAEIALKRVLASRPGSPLRVLTDPTRPVTAFLPTDRAMIEALDRYEGWTRTESIAALRLRLLMRVDTLERVLLYATAEGTADAATLTGAGQTSLTALDGRSLQVRADSAGTLFVTDGAPRSPDATVVDPDGNLGQVQLVHGVDVVLLPADVRPWWWRFAGWF